jgi:hypothetical protein
MSTNTHSRVYQKRLKNLIESLKNLYPLLTRIPKPLPRPGTDAFRAAAKGDAKSDTKRKEEFTKRDSLRLDSSVPRYFLDAATLDDRRTRS